MKTLLLWVILGAASHPVNPFDGTWVTRPESVATKKPWVIGLEKGVWTSDLSTPPVKVRADGKDQQAPGHLGFTTVAVKVTGPTSVEVTSKNGGRVVFVRSLSVGADGKSMVEKWTDRTGPQAATGETLYERLVKGSTGAHAVSGTWKPAKEQNLSATASTTAYRTTVNGLTCTLASGLSYLAKFDGKDYPVAGDTAGGQTVSLKRNGDRSFTETFKRAGRIVEVDRITVSSDGKAMRVEWERPVDHRSGSYEAVKQEPSTQR